LVEYDALREQSRPYEHEKYEELVNGRFKSELLGNKSDQNQAGEERLQPNDVTCS
jgi:hypothetical protein